MVIASRLITQKNIEPRLSNINMSALARMQDFEYLYASNTNVSNFVSVKLSGSHNYLQWKAQILCLLDSNNMCGIVDATFVGPKYSGPETMRQYDSLARGWILGSVSEDVLIQVYNLCSAKAVWSKLKMICDPAICFQGDSASKRSDAKTENEDINAVSSETGGTTEEDSNSIEIIVPSKKEDTEKKEWLSNYHRELRAATIKGNWALLEYELKRDQGLVTKAISSDGSTILHIAVGTGHNDVVKNVLTYMNDEQVLKKRDYDGSTALHIAAIVGNKDAAELLVKKNRELLRSKDNKSNEALHKAYENMHLDTIGYLLKAANDDGKTELQSSLAGSVNPDEEIGANLLVNTISAKQYSLASGLVQKFPEFASKSDDVLMAIAKTFPGGLDYWETLVYPSLDIILELLHIATSGIAYNFTSPSISTFQYFKNKEENVNVIFTVMSSVILWVLLTVINMLIFSLTFILFLILVACFICLLFYSLCWNFGKILFSPIKQIEIKKKEWDEAKKVLELVCDEIDKLEYTGNHHPYYTRPILEAACHNAYKVVDEILFRSPESIQSTDKNGYDIIQLAIINRSEKIYNLVYDIGERKNLYRTYKDSYENNILHLAGRLAPSSVLNHRTGAALQLQRELQWREEVKKHVFPTYITQENIYKETPGMVFTREHENLVKEGEQWMKTTAESCSITAALITTIVFAAAITVPGGSHQEKGTPLFEKKSAFIVFAISDAISLFTSTTALLVFLSILTARFAETDFLVSLPRRLFIGLFALLLSTTTMIVAFGATLFLVFCDENLWMLAPICGLAVIPIASFVGLQFPLMVDLYRSTYLRIFGKKRFGFLRRFNPDDIRLHFGK